MRKPQQFRASPASKRFAPHSPRSRGTGQARAIGENSRNSARLRPPDRFTPSLYGRSGPVPEAPATSQCFRIIHIVNVRNAAGWSSRSTRHEICSNGQEPRIVGERVPKVGYVVSCATGVSRMEPAPTQDDVPSISITKLVASGVVRKDMSYVCVELNGFRRNVGLARRDFPNGGWWLHFICNNCRRRARVLRLCKRGIACWRCAGLPHRVQCLSKSERAAQRVERLEAVLYGGPARLHPRPGRTLDRRRSLQLSLKRAQVSAREGLLR